MSHVTEVDVGRLTPVVAGAAMAARSFAKAISLNAVLLARFFALADRACAAAAICFSRIVELSDRDSSCAALDFAGGILMPVTNCSSDWCYRLNLVVVDECMLEMVSMASCNVVEISKSTNVKSSLARAGDTRSASCVIGTSAFGCDAGIPAGFPALSLRLADCRRLKARDSYLYANSLTSQVYSIKPWPTQ